MPLGKINRWLSGAEVSKIASTPLSERLNLTTLGADPLGDLAMHIMQQISERKIELETIRQRRVAEVNM